MTARGPSTGVELLLFLIGHAAIGGLVAVGAVALALAADFMNLRTLVSASESGLLALAVMTAFFVITFASVQMGFALMLAAESGGQDTDGQRQAAGARRARLQACLARWRPVAGAGARPARAPAHSGARRPRQ